MPRFTECTNIYRSWRTAVMEYPSSLRFDATSWIFALMAPAFHPSLQCCNTPTLRALFKNKITGSIHLLSVHRTEWKWSMWAQRI